MIRMKHLVSAFALLTLCAGTLSADVLLSLHGPSSPVAVGSGFIIDVNISGVIDLASYQFDVGFNPAFASATSVLEGAFLPSVGPTLFVPGTIDNLAGTIRFNAGVLAGLGSGASGSGVLASLHFNALSGGTGTFTLLSTLLYDSVPNPIDVTITNATVSAQTSTVPEPAAGWLLAGCIGAITLIRRGAWISR